MTRGHFSYSLDDPYIHLALAQQIIRGHYGLNPGEVSAPGGQHAELHGTHQDLAQR
jgi:hypothetical protein